MLIAVALLASMVPALRATRSDLVEALRQEWTDRPAFRGIGGSIPTTSHRSWGIPGLARSMSCIGNAPEFGSACGRSFASHQ